VPPLVPLAEHTITSNEALDLESLPKKVAIIGAGYIACEFAGIFHGSGSDVTIVRSSSCTLTLSLSLCIAPCVSGLLTHNGLRIWTHDYRSIADLCC
jgi:pyruvate/2-oxoglutarate dehydrogenase complex dihydrolipoamide dehydrogenase (E3) component